MAPVRVYFERLYPHSKAPTKAYDSDAGWDLYVAEESVVEPGKMVDVSVGVKMAIGSGWYGHIMGRSSTFFRLGLVVSEGVIDAGYRGEMSVNVYNPNNEERLLMVGQRVAQLLILPVPEVQWTEVKNLPNSDRGHRGYGSSG